MALSGSANRPRKLIPLSQAVKAGGLIFISGTFSVDSKTRQAVSGDSAVQTIRVLDSLKGITKVKGGFFSIDFLDIYL